jgi:tetratricopeptide (TPR) repeat protein
VYHVTSRRARNAGTSDSTAPICPTLTHPSSPMHVKSLLILLASATLTSPVLAQDVVSLVARGDSAYAVFSAEEALTLYESALAMDSTNANALAKASRTAVDVAESLTDAARQKELFRKGERYARLAVHADSASAENWFHLARALGRTALSVGVRDRVRFAVEIRRCAEKALAINPDHPGALHVLGMWNAEVKRLSGVELFFARRFLGGGVLGQANWKDAVSYMERAVSVDPERIAHKLDLAGVYADTREKEKARAAYEAVIAYPTRVDFNDSLYKKQAEERLKKLR